MKVLKTTIKYIHGYISNRIYKLGWAFKNFLRGKATLKVFLEEGWAQFIDPALLR